MYNKGDIIVYGATGVCLVKEVGKPEIAGLPNDIDYYTLQPLSDNHRETICVPTTTKCFMRQAVTAQQAMEYISAIGGIQPSEPQSRNPKATADFYSRLIGSYDIKNMLTVIVTLVTKRRECAAKGKRLNQTQLTYLKKAQELVYSEFSIALDKPREEIEQLIDSHIAL